MSAISRARFLCATVFLTPRRATLPYVDPFDCAVIRLYDDAGNVIETHEHTGDFKEPQASHVKQKAATQRSVTADCDQV
jgi:hypothetical protein